jgi:hypothetical protein
MRPAALTSRSPGRSPALLAILAAALALAGCGSAAVGPEITTAAVSTAVLVATDKTITDHVVSAVRGEDCSIVAYERNGTYCSPYPPEMQVVQEEIYCYRTLADIDCYAVPNPFGGSAQPVSRHFTRNVLRSVEAAP